MTEEQREALRKLFEEEHPSPLEAGLAVSKLIGCAVIPTREIVWVKPGKEPWRVATLQEINGRFKWVEDSYKKGVVGNA
jgi:hypothetical protein